MRDIRVFTGNIAKRIGFAPSKNSIIIFFTAIVFSLGLVSGYQLKRYHVLQAKSHARLVKISDALKELKDVRILSERLEPRLKHETSPLKIAQLLRNLIYSRIPWVTDPGVRYSGYDWLEIGDTFRKSVLDPSYAHMCGGRTIQLLVALRAFGLSARKVGIYPSVTNLPKMAVSHASVEVLIDGQWIVQDPTFNFTLVDREDRPVGWMEAASLISNGQMVRHETDGFIIAPKHSFEDYSKLTGTVLPNLIKYVNTGPYLNNNRLQKATKYPEIWDGQLRHSDGTIFPVFEKDTQEIYNLLAQPPK